jgi:hypothetical protein
MAQLPADRIHAHHDLSHDGIEKQPDSVRRFGFAMYLAGGGAGLQQPIAKIEAKQIRHWYQHLICANEPLPMLRCTTVEYRKFGRILQLVLPLVAIDRDCDPVHPCRQGDAFSGWMPSTFQNVM